MEETTLSTEAVRNWLKTNFSWLGTDEEVDGADVVDRLNDLYREAGDHEYQNPDEEA